MRPALRGHAACGLLGYLSCRQASSFATLGWIQMCVCDDTPPGVTNTTKSQKGEADEANMDSRGVDFHILLFYLMSWLRLATNPGQRAWGLRSCSNVSNTKACTGYLGHPFIENDGLC